MPEINSFESAGVVEEGDLLDRYLSSGDLEAREELAVRLYRIIYREAICVAPTLGLHWRTEDSEDFTQDMLAKIFTGDGRRLRSLKNRSTGGLFCWTKAVARNGMIDARKSLAERRRDATSSLDADLGDGNSDKFTLAHLLPDLAEDPKAKLLYRELIEALRSAKEEAFDSPKKQAVLDLWCQGYKYDEISVMVGTPPGTVGSIIHRAISSIAERLNTEGFES